MQKITVYPYPGKHNGKFSKIGEEKISGYLRDYYQKNTCLLHSARAGLYAGLTYYNFSRNRDTILVPQYLSKCVLDVLSHHIFSVQAADDKTRAILVFHQWGFPQRMDKILPIAEKNKWLIIEDCAHAIGSRYGGKLTGTFGDFSLFSFPKIFSTYTGGMLASSNADLIAYVTAMKKKKEGIFFRRLRKESLELMRKYYADQKESPMLEVCYSAYPYLMHIDKESLKLFPSTQEYFDECLKKRKENFSYIKEQMKSFLYNSNLETASDVYPFAVPIFASDDMLEKIKRALALNNFLVEILHFDIERNMLNPNYQKCVALPCHQLIEKRRLEEMVEIINTCAI